ncbi:hypothetical protein GF362_05365 [Candidatus Dojkabacteria bacterium]|nr:hypothetical protein [Candidatus Dojkabacteria bacterium]
MKKHFVAKKSIAVFTCIAIFVMPLLTGFPKHAYAATLTDVSVSLTNESVSSTDNIVITFTPNTAISSGSILEIAYEEDSAGPDGFDGGAQLTNGDVVVTGTNITSSTESDFADGYFKSTIQASANVTTTVTITIDGANELTNPTASGNFNFSVSVDIGGAGSTYDYGAGLAYVGDDNDVEITAIVPPVIDMELYQTGTDSELVDPNTCSLGTLSLNHVKDCDYDLGYATNNTAGLTVQVERDGLLDDGLGNDINNVTDGAVTAGIEEYGFQITDPGAGNCYTTLTSSYDDGSDEEVPAGPANFFITDATCNGTTVGQSAERIEVSHRASMDTNTIVGSYDQLVTYTAYTN